MPLRVCITEYISPSMPPWVCITVYTQHVSLCVYNGVYPACLPVYIREAQRGASYPPSLGELGITRRVVGSTFGRRVRVNVDNARMVGGGRRDTLHMPPGTLGSLLSRHIQPIIGSWVHHAHSRAAPARCHRHGGIGGYGEGA